MTIPFRAFLPLLAFAFSCVTGSLRADGDTTPLPIPVITFTSSNYSELFLSDFLFDGLPTVGSNSSLGGQWAGVGVGPHYIDLDFGATVSTDCFGYAQRLGRTPSLDKTITFELFFSDVAETFGPSPDLTIDSGINISDDNFTLYSLGGVYSGRYLRFQVTGNAGNVGGSELRFFQAQVGQPEVTTSQATGVGTSSATLNGVVTDPGSSTPTVTLFHGLADGGTDPGSWDTSISLGSQSGAFASPVSGLLPNRTYFFTARAVNGSGESWASPVLNFTTAVAAPALDNIAASDIAAGSATIGAGVTDNGGADPLVTIFHGTSNGGTDPNAWDASVPLGPQGGSVTTPLAGLSHNTTYFHRARASNAGGTSWAESSASFTTAIATLPAVVNDPATAINGFSAILHGQITDPGNDPPAITIFYGDNDGGTDQGLWDTSVDLGVQAGAFQQLVSGLPSLTPHYFRARATNAAGSAWAPSSATFTTTAFVPVLVYINEFLADTDRDSDELQADLPYCDEDGDPEDWIELYNPGASAIDLGGYYLTDKSTTLTKWQFPSPTTIPGGQYLVVFASNKDRAVAGSELHTNFRLSKDGEYLALVGPDGSSIVREFSPAYPALAKHFSYGLVPPASGGSLDHFEVPTPGAANTTTPGRPADPVVFDLVSQTFTTSLSLSLTTASPSAEIRYTTDGSSPTSSSTVYSATIPITTTTQVRARAFETGFAPGPIESATFLKINPNVSTFTSNLPIVILEDFGAGRPDSDTTMHWSICEPDPVSGRSSPLTLNFDTRGRMKVRGSSSAGWPKYSLTMEAWNERNEDKDVSPLGLPAESDWVLSGRYEYDRALMRNEFIYEMSNQIGRYAVRTRFVEVFINTGNGVIDYNEDYMGVYALMERIKRDNDRVDVERLTKTDIQEPEVNGGYIIKMDRLDPGDSGWTSALGIPGTEPFGNESALAHVYPKEEDILPAQRDYIRNYIDEFEAAINDPGYIHPSTGLHYSDYIDVGSWVDHAWLNMLATNPDALRLSTFMFKPRGGKLHAGPVWDFDRTMESLDPRDDSPLRFSAAQPATDLMTWGWWEQLFAEPDFEQQWIDRWFELRRGPFLDSNILSVINGLEAELAEAQARNFVRWSSKPPRGGAHASEVTILKDWLTEHTAWIDAQFLPLPWLSPATGQITAGTLVSVSNGANDAYFTTDGSDPRLPGGSPSPSATFLASGADITVNSTSEIVIRTYQGGTWGAPATEIYTLDTQASALNLVVSEIMYHPLGPSPGELAAGFTQAGSFEFLEIHNPTTQPLALNGVVISEAFDFAFSDGSILTLAPGAYALVVRNQAAFEYRYGFGHPIAGEYGDSSLPDGGQNLSDGGERILITAANASTIADFTYLDRLPWPPAADGLGYSLVLRQPDSFPDHSLAASWRSSAIASANPGTSDATTFSGTPNADTDHNGIADLMDYALGHAPGTRDGIPTFSLTTDVITFSYMQDLAADDVTLTAEWSTNLLDWQPLGAGFDLISLLPDGGGRQTIVYASNPVTFPLGERLFVRLKAAQ